MTKIEIFMYIVVSGYFKIMQKFFERVLYMRGYFGLQYTVISLFTINNDIANILFISLIYTFIYAYIQLLYNYYNLQIYDFITIIAYICMKIRLLFILFYTYVILL